MSDIFPDWYNPITTINSTATVVSSTDSKVALNKLGNRRYMRLTNLGPNTEFLAFKSVNAVKAVGLRLASGETWESSIPLGNPITDTVSVISSASATNQRLLKVECY